MKMNFYTYVKRLFNHNFPTTIITDLQINHKQTRHRTRILFIFYPYDTVVKNRTTCDKICIQITKGIIAHLAVAFRKDNNGSRATLWVLLTWVGPPQSHQNQIDREETHVANPLRKLEPYLCLGPFGCFVRT